MPQMGQITVRHMKALPNGTTESGAPTNGTECVELLNRLFPGNDLRLPESSTNGWWSCEEVGGGGGGREEDGGCADCGRG